MISNCRTLFISISQLEVPIRGLVILHIPGICLSKNVQLWTVMDSDVDRCYSMNRNRNLQGECFRVLPNFHKCFYNISEHGGKMFSISFIK